MDGLETVTVSEMETVHLSCPLRNIATVFWRVRTLLNGKYSTYIVEHQNELSDDFKETGRYNATYNEGHYILTIINVNVTEAGEYSCSEDGYFDGMLVPVGRIVLRVYGRLDRIFSIIAL